MRVIGGELKGRRIDIPKNLPARPTTDFAREGLFNILNNRINFEGLNILDMFSGTGLISLEFFSRGAVSSVSIDNHPNCVNHLRKLAKSFQLKWTIYKRNVFYFLNNHEGSYDLIFADPPYDLKEIPQIPELVYKAEGLLKPGGLLIVEHSKRTDLSQVINFVEMRKFGNVVFSFFKAS